MKYCKKNNSPSCEYPMCVCGLSQAKAHKCSECGCVQYGYNNDCMICGAELNDLTEISKPTFDELIKKAVK